MDHEKKITNISQDQLKLNQRITQNTISLGQTPNWIRKLTLPKFAGRHFEKPMQYLRDLKRYLDISGIHGDFPYLIHDSLTGTPLQWWQLVEEELDTFETFKIKFIKRFWNENTQRNIAHNLEFGFYNDFKQKKRTTLYN